MIRSRVLTFHRQAQVVASQTDLTLGAIVLPKTGKIKSIKAHLLTKTGANAAQLNFYRSGAAGSTAAASTTAVNSAALDMTSDAIVAATLVSPANFIAGEVLYIKATTGGTTTMDVISVTVEVDF